MNVLNNVYQGAQNYYQEIPSNSLRELAVASAQAFCMETILSGKPLQGLVSGGLSVLATSIYALITPIFKRLGYPPVLDETQEMCRRMISIISAGCMAQAFGNNSILNKLVVLSIIEFIEVIYINNACLLDMTHHITIYPNFKAVAN